MLAVVDQALREPKLGGVCDLRLELAEAELERLFDVACDTDGIFLVDDRAVDDDLDRVLFRLAQLDLFIQPHQHSVDLSAHVALLAQALQHIGEAALFLAHQGRAQDHLRAVRQLHNLGDDVAGTHL